MHKIIFSPLSLLFPFLKMKKFACNSFFISHSLSLMCVYMQKTKIKKISHSLNIEEASTYKASARVNKACRKKQHFYDCCTCHSIIVKFMAYMY